MNLGSMLAGAGIAINAAQDQQERQQRLALQKMELQQAAVKFQFAQQQAQLAQQADHIDMMAAFHEQGGGDQQPPSPYSVSQGPGAGGPPQGMPQQGGMPQGGGPLPGARPMLGGAQMGGQMPPGGGMPQMPPRPQQPMQQVPGPGMGQPQGQQQGQPQTLANFQPVTFGQVVQQMQQAAPPGTPGQAIMMAAQRAWPQVDAQNKQKIEILKAQAAEADRQASRQDREQDHRDSEGDRAAQRSMERQFHADSEQDRALTRSISAQKAAGAQTSPEDEGRIVDAIGNYKMPPPNISQSRNPKNLTLMAKVYEKYPDYDAKTYTSEGRAQNAAVAGPLANTIRSFTVVDSHLDTLSKLGAALGNGDSRAINALSNTFKTQFGQAAPTSFNAAKSLVGDEVVKAVIGAGGALGDRDAIQQQISAASSPAQLKGVIDTFRALVQGQIRGIQQQVERGTGKPFPMGGQGAAAAPQQIADGATATNPQTGQRLVFRGGQWQPQ